MAIWSAHVEFGGASGLPRDRIVNTWSFEGSPTATDTANIDDMLWDFYDTPVASTAPTSIMPTDIVNGEVDIKIYCMDDPMPRVPRATYEHTFTGSTGNPLPAEVALCLSYHAAPVAGVPQARRRGRVYLGPFTAAESTDGRPGTALTNMLLAQAAQLLAAAQASVTWQWIVWSRTLDSGAPVTGGWIDDAWDTQRRRGPDSTTRTLFS